MVAVRTVHVAVLDFLGGRRPHLRHLDLEVQGLAGQRMVCVHASIAAW